MTRSVATVALLASCILATACGSNARGSGGPPSRDVLVFAAASLTQAFTALAPGFERAHPTYSLRFNFAGTPTLLTQLQSGAHADVFASADQSNMEKAATGGLVTAAPAVFAHNVLEIAVAPGNPKHIASLADLARKDVSLVLAAPNVPAGRYAAQALAQAGVSTQPKSLEVDVESTLAKVELGEADAAIVYATDVRAAGARVTGVTIPAAQNVVATYPVAELAGAPDPNGAAAFVAYLLSPTARQVLSRFGFALP